jgi:hypothetical protein
MHLMTLLAQAQPDQQQIMSAMMAIIPMIMIFALICVAVIIIPFWFICKKAGFSPWLALLNLIPLGNLILIYVLAFSDWKVGPPPPATWATGFPPNPPTA